MLTTNNAMAGQAVTSKDFKEVAAAFPHLEYQLAISWGNPEFSKLTSELQQNWRNEQKAGCPHDVFRALKDLVSAHDIAYPKLARKGRDPWGVSDAR